MKFLIDKSSNDVRRKTKSTLVLGQLLTPLTKYKNWGGAFAVDNGCFNQFREHNFVSLLSRNEPDHCLFVTAPDIVGNAQRTIELWNQRHRWIDLRWPVAFVCQDGQECLPIPWDELDAIFIGGCDPWKDSKSALDIVHTAKRLGIHVHVGRVNTASRYERFADVGADTCDGSGIAMYDHMLDTLERRINSPQPTLFDGLE